MPTVPVILGTVDENGHSRVCTGATDAPVLVLHEPATAVDSVTEQTIAGRLRDFRTGRSTLLITSSPALLAACDRVVDLLESTSAR